MVMKTSKKSEETIQEVPEKSKSNVIVVDFAGSVDIGYTNSRYICSSRT